MATFNEERKPLIYTPETVDALQKALDLPADICNAHIRAMVTRKTRERLQHATKGLDLIHDLGELEDDPKGQMVRSLQESLQALATQLSIKLYKNMPKTAVAWTEATSIVREIFDREMGEGWQSPNPLQAFSSDSEIVAEALVSSDAQGHFSHGTGRVLRYIQWMLDGRMDPNGKCNTTFEDEHMMRYDGACTYGQVAFQWGMEQAMEKAEERGNFLMAFYDAGHVGRLEFFIRQALRRNFFCIGALNTNGGRGALDMHGTESLLGTNPMAWGIPDGDEGILVDTATTQYPEGVINMMLQEALRCATDMLREPDGSVTTDPSRLYRPSPTALLLPMGGRQGGHKGLAWGIGGVDASIIALTEKGRMGTGNKKTSPNGANNGWLLLHKMPGDGHHEILRTYADILANVKVQKGTKRRGVFPGVRGYRAEQAARDSVVRIPKNVWQNVVDFHKTGIMPDVIT